MSVQPAIKFIKRAIVLMDFNVQRLRAQSFGSFSVSGRESGEREHLANRFEV